MNKFAAGGLLGGIALVSGLLIYGINTRDTKEDDDESDSYDNENEDKGKHKDKNEKLSKPEEPLTNPKKRRESRRTSTSKNIASTTISRSKTSTRRNRTDY